MAETCFFCKIAAGEIPDVAFVHQDDDVIAFHDNNPQAPTHILVIPRTHIASSMADLKPDDARILAQIFTVANSIAVEQGLVNGYRFVTNIGPDGGQSIHHLHFHLLGGRKLGWPPG